VKRWRFASIVLLGACLAGCVTSTEFKIGASHVGPDIAMRADRYAAMDAPKKSQAAKLKQDCAVRDDISRPMVREDWSAIKSWYMAGVSTEMDGNEKILFDDWADAMDKLIAADEARPFKWFGK